MSPARLLCAAIPLALLPACSESLPFPPTGPIPPDALVEVPYPPPAARVETVPPHAEDGEVWVDGQWDWAGTEWRWAGGAWTRPPAGAYFTPWQTVRRSDGRLFFARATWRAKGGRPLDVAGGHAVCPAEPAGEVVKP